MPIYSIIAVITIAVLFGVTKHKLETKEWHGEVAYLVMFFTGMLWPLGLPILLGMWGIPLLIKKAKELEEENKND